MKIVDWYIHLKAGLLISNNKSFSYRHKCEPDKQVTFWTRDDHSFYAALKARPQIFFYYFSLMEKKPNKYLI